MIHAHTQITGLIGYPIAHSKSYAMHNAALQTCDLSAVYVSLPCPQIQDLENILSAFRTQAFVGANVTTPHKKNIIPLLDRLDNEAEQIGAVNTVCTDKKGTLIGKNSDAQGFRNALDEDEILYRDRPVFIIGAGGAARAVAHALAPYASSITIYNRTTQHAEHLVDDLKQHNPTRSFGICNDPNQYVADPQSVLIQCTPVGRNGETPPHPPLHPHMTVVDLLYTNTPLLQKAKRLGCTTQDGNPMLIHQAALSFSWWFSCSPPLEIMRETNNQLRSFA